MALGFEFQSNLSVCGVPLNLAPTLKDAIKGKSGRDLAKAVNAFCEKQDLSKNGTYLPKGGKVYDTSTWAITADGKDSEFVTIPVEADAPPDPASTDCPGERQIFAQMNGLEQWCDQFMAFLANRKAWGDLPWILGDEDPKLFGRGAGLILWRLNGPTISAFAQVSGGVQLKRLRRLFRALTKDSNTEAAKVLLGESLHATYAKSLANVTQDLTADEIKKQIRAAGWTNHDPSSALRGLITLVALYLARGNAAAKVKVVKQLFFIMARTQFGALFLSLPKAERDLISAHPDRWVGLICDRVMPAVKYAGNSMGKLDPRGPVIGQGVTDYGDLAQPVNIPVTREAWLKGILAGKDLISEIAYSPSTLTDSEKTIFVDVHGDHRLRGLGGLGDKMDQIVLDDLKKPVLAPVFEFRGPTYEPTFRMDYKAWKPYALKAYKFLYAVNSLSRDEKIDESTIFA